MGKIPKCVNKMHFTMFYGNYCFIFIENFLQKFSACRVALNYGKKKLIDPAIPSNLFQIIQKKYEPGIFFILILTRATRSFSNFIDGKTWISCSFRFFFLVNTMARKIWNNAIVWSWVMLFKRVVLSFTFGFILSEFELTEY